MELLNSRVSTIIPNGPVAMNTHLGKISGPMLGQFEEFEDFEDSGSKITHILQTTLSIEESNRRADSRN